VDVPIPSKSPESIEKTKLKGWICSQYNATAASLLPTAVCTGAARKREEIWAAPTAAPSVLAV